MPVPESVLKIARTLEEAGFEVWCVGGAIRDYVLGLDLEGSDADLATSAPPDAVRALFRRTIPIGIEHGTVAVFGTDRKPHEVTTFRRDVRTDGRHAVVEFGVSLDEDLARRDLTINAIAYHPLRNEWRDPFGGAQDLDAGLIKAVGDPRRRFREDYLRILRAVRFAARFQFTVEPATWEAAREVAPSLEYLSAERVREEWWKGIQTARVASELVTGWRDVGGLAVWMPEIPRTGAAWEAALRAVDRLPRDPVLVTARLSPDPATTLRRLRCSNAEVERVAAIDRFRADGPPTGDVVAVRRWLSRVDALADDLLTLWEAEGADGSLREAVDAIRRDGSPLTLGDLALSGTELMDLGVPEGPAVGRVLRRLLERVLDDPELNRPDALAALARELMEERDA